MVDFITRRSHIDESKGSIIDRVYVNTPEIIQSVKPLPGLGKSDHDIVTFDISLNRHQNSQSRPVLMYHRLNIDDFLQTLNDTPWDLCFSDPPDVDYAHNFKDLFLAVVNDVVPRSMPKKRRRAPWISNDIIRLIRKKRRLYKAAKSTNSAAKWFKYKTFRNTVKYQVKISYAKYVKTLADDVGQNPKRFWSFVKSRKISPPVSSFTSIMKRSLILLKLHTFLLHIFRTISLSINLFLTPMILLIIVRMI
jgi:hypothetical protein